MRGVILVLMLCSWLSGQTFSQAYNMEGIYAVFETNKGIITVLLDHRNTPMTVANIVGLAEGTIQTLHILPGNHSSTVPYGTGLSRAT